MQQLNLQLLHKTKKIIPTLVLMEPLRGSIMLDELIGI